MIGVLAGDAEIVARDVVGYFSAPLSFTGADWQRAMAAAGGVGAFLAMDESLNRLFARNPHPGYLERPFDWGEEWGRLRTMQYASIALYAGGLISGSDGVRVTGRLMGEALLLAGLPAITLQYGLGRSRPHAGRGAWNLNWFEWANERQSFPSGHGTVAFAISTVLAGRIDRWWASVPLYASAGLAVLSLGWTDQHWPSDLVVGAALGYLAGSYVVTREEERSAGRRAGDRSRFDVGLGVGGVTARYRIY